MVTIQTSCVRTTPCCLGSVSDVTFNGSQIVFLRCGECILVDWGDCGQKPQIVCLPRVYHKLCYDSKHCCYWALGACEAKLYKLDSCFQEVGQYPLRGTYRQRANGLSCDCLGEGIWLSYPSQIAYLELQSGKTTVISNQDKSKLNLGILSLCCCRAVSCLTNGKQLIEVTCTNSCERVEFSIPSSYRFIGMLPCCAVPLEPPGDGCACCVSLVLIEKCTHKLVLMECQVFIDSSGAECCCGDCCHRYCIDECCDPCGGGDCPECCHCAKYEVIHSIALEEAGISHILNAEGEKLQKAVASTDNIDQLLRVNESVRRTISQITLLEGQLYSKLEAVQDFCVPPGPNPYGPCC